MSHAIVVNAYAEGTVSANAARRIGLALVFQRLWEETSCRRVIEDLAGSRKHGFSSSAPRAQASPAPPSPFPSRICALPSEASADARSKLVGKFEGVQRGVARDPRVGRGLARQKGLGEQFIRFETRAGFDAIVQQRDRLVALIGNGPLLRPA